jgi:hypothetical protein
LEFRAKFSALRAKAADRDLAAFRPLYDSLSDAQKKAADAVMEEHHRGHGDWGHHDDHQ